jgi:hypothetical protein
MNQQSKKGRISFECGANKNVVTTQTESLIP